MASQAFAGALRMTGVTHPHTHTHTRAHTQHTHTCTYAHARTHTHTHAHTHTIHTMHTHLNVGDPYFQVVISPPLDLPPQNAFWTPSKPNLGHFFMGGGGPPTPRGPKNAQSGPFSTR